MGRRYRHRSVDAPVQGLALGGGPGAYVGIIGVCAFAAALMFCFALSFSGRVDFSKLFGSLTR